MRLCISLPCALALLLIASWFAIDWSEEGSASYPGGVILRDSTGRVIRVALGPDDVDCRPWYEASPDDWIVKALVAAEDGTFWTHHGIRPLSMLRALSQNLFSARRISGASTITMQAVRLIAPHPKTYVQKWIEAVRAVKMERRKSKTWILSQYLNRAPFGSNFVGIEAAAQGWFGKSAKELGLGEAALLAGMVQAPSRFRPDRGYERAIKRRDYVLARLLELGWITSEQAEGAKSVRPEICRAPRPFLSPHYCDFFLREKAKASGVEKLQSGDYTTPLDPAIQSLCESIVEASSPESSYSIAAVVQRVSTGEVVALACSGDYFDQRDGQVNTALAPRPAGSTLKPFLVAQAMDLGILGSESEVVDLPLALKGYRPANFDGMYRGKLPLREALILSLNLPFVRLCREVGVMRFGAYLRGLGFNHLGAPDESYGLGMAIGNVEVTLVELVNAYRRLAASNTPSAYLVSEMLAGEERSAAAFGHIADVALPKFAWKTGTSSAYRDAWTVAWNPDYAIGVWCGHKSGGFNDESLVGAKAAAPLVWKIARALYPQNDSPWFAKPQGADALRERRLPPRPAEQTLAIAKPAAGTTFARVPGMEQQRLVATVIGNGEETRLWWFLDGQPIGESIGLKPFVLELTPGRHTLSCSTEEGATAETNYTVLP